MILRAYNTIKVWLRFVIAKDIHRETLTRKLSKDALIDYGYTSSRLKVYCENLH